MNVRLVVSIAALLASSVAARIPAAAQRLYPVTGPATTQTPPPQFTAKMTTIFAKGGKISLTLGDMETFEGTWTTVTADTVNRAEPGSPLPAPPQANLAYAWDMVYGQGYFLANVLGSQLLGQAIAKGSRGTILQIEFHKTSLGNADVNTFGVAVDNKGNVYKVVL